MLVKAMNLVLLWILLIGNGFLRNRTEYIVGDTHANNHDRGTYIAQAKISGEHFMYLPAVFSNILPLLVADFNNCKPENNLGGGMGTAYNPPDYLLETYFKDDGHGCVVKLDYHITYWSSFWLKLQLIDLTPYKKLVFDIRSDPQDIPAEIKIELKRAVDMEVSIIYVSGISATWQTITIYLSDFGPTGYMPPISSFSDMEELVFTFEADHSGKSGVVYLDNITFEP
jgi:hypothetical protein